MPMRDDWVTAIFDRLSAAYGQRFVTQWQGMDPEKVRAFWAHELDGITSGGVAHALANLPHDYPPTAMAFRALCNRRPLPTVKALPLPTVKADPERVARCLRVLNRGPRDPLAWAHDLRQREEAGERLQPVQRRMWRMALPFFDRTPGASTGAASSPINADLPHPLPQVDP